MKVFVFSWDEYDGVTGSRIYDHPPTQEELLKCADDNKEDFQFAYGESDEHQAADMISILLTEGHYSTGGWGMYYTLEERTVH
jgi:hypothetical protein